MKKSVCRIVLALLCGVLGMASVSEAQTCVSVDPEPLYRFRVPSSRLGYLLTRNYWEGVNLGYIYEGPLVPYYGAPAAGMLHNQVRAGVTIPIHRYRITQRSTPYYGFFNGLAPYASDYHYEGIAGYALPGFGQYGGTPVHAYYSQDYGYWYTANPYEAPPASSYQYHGVPFYLFTQAGQQTFCMPACDANQEQSCHNLQGVWDPVSCTCGAPADQCAPYYQNQCSRNGGSWNYGICECEFPQDPCQIDPWSCQQCNPRYQICNIEYN